MTIFAKKHTAEEGWMWRDRIKELEARRQNESQQEAENWRKDNCNQTEQKSFKGMY